MGFKQITVSSALLIACSSAGANPDRSPEGGSKTIAESSGSQTGGEGTSDACKTISTTQIDVEDARAAGFPVDEHLELFDQTFDQPFHRGNLDCSVLPPSIDGQIEVHASLLGIDLVQREPVSPEAAEACPTWRQTHLRYRAMITVTTDDGTLTGSFESEAQASHPAPGATSHAGLVFAISEAPAQFSGSLGIRVDPSRAYIGQVGGQIALGSTVWDSWLLTSVVYSDSGEPPQDQGDGLFWPYDFQDVNGQRPCGWLDVPGEQRLPITIDEFNDL